MIDIANQFMDAISSAGLNQPEKIIDDGKIHRFSSSGKARDESGWYVLHSDGVAAGAFGCWREGFTQNWCSKASTQMTEAERDAHQRRLQAIQVQRDSEREKRNESAAVQATSRFDAATSCTSHLYLTMKGVQAHGIRQEGENLLIPMRDTAGKLHSLQTITSNGDKRFIAGGRVKGCYFAIGKPTAKLIVCEGYATGASIFEATGDAVAVAFNASNLEPVALSLRAKYPDLKIVLAADDDYQTNGNPGMFKARSAAISIGGDLAVPDFGDNRPNKATDFNDLHLLAGRDAVKVCIYNALNSAAAFATNTVVPGKLDIWLEPKEVKSDLPPAPAFDAKTLLPATLADFVLDEADRMPCSPDYIAAALIVCLGSVIGARCGIKPKRRDDWLVTPNLFGGIVGDPSTKKSPALGTVTRFLDRLEVKEAEKLEDEKKIFEAEKAAFEAHQSAVKASMKKAAGGKGDRLRMDAAIADLQDLKPPEEPKERRFKSNDSTVEKLGDLLVHNPQGMLVYRDELMGLLASWEKEGKEGDKAFYLEGWNGTASFNIDRIGRGSLHVKNLCISVFGGIQPELLERYLAGITTSLDNDGRIQRFQVMVYPNAVAWEWRDRYPVKGAREAVRDLFDRLAVFDPVQDGATPSDDFVKLPHFCFDDAAQAIFVEWCTELHTVHIANEQNPLMQQHFGKFEKLFCSIALILHLAEGSIGSVTATSALRAAAWCEYLTGHARRIYALVETAKVTTARMVSRRLAEGKLDDGFTVRDMVRKQWSGVTTVKQAEVALAILEESRHVQSQDGINTLGRPTIRYYINPQIKKVAKS
jgi:phage/plasmid primase-like uncharacterized protein